MRRRVNDATKLTCSAGVGPNKMLAKIGSDMNKPNGTFIIEFTNEKVEELMNSMSIRKIPGIGRVTEGVLNELGIFKCSDAIENAPLLVMAEYDYVVR
jgi:DNA polymerase kappa